MQDSSKAKDKHEQKPNIFHRFAQKVSDFVGNVWVFIAMLFLVLAWVLSGPFFGFSDTWQLIINTTTTIITFLIVFIIQNTQNRDTKALQLKLDELIRVHKLAHNSLIDLDVLSDDQIKELEKHFVEISKSNEENN